MTKFWTVGIVLMADQITEVQRVKQATMNGYFYVLTAIDLFVLSFMCILTKLSESLNKKQKQGFFFAFALIAVISVLEVVTLAVDGTPAGYRWLNILSNYLGFGLSPGVCLCLVYVMDRKKRMNRWFRAAVCCEACYLLFLALSIPAGLVFSVSADNVYSRGQYFYIYIIMYFAAIVYLSVSTFVTAREFQNRSRALIYPLMIFLLIETIIQVTLPELHVTWLCVTLLSVLYFIYCSEMWNQLDALTGLLNQNSYLNRTAEMRRRGGVLVVFGVMVITNPLYKTAQARLDRVLGLTRENLTGVRVVRAFDKEQSEIDRFESANDLLTRMQLHVGHISSLMSPLTYVIINLAIVALLYVGSIEINVGGMASGDVIALVNYMNQILVELVKLANLIVQVSKALACAGRVQAVLDTEPGMEFPTALKGEAPADKAGDAVRFDHVSLTYAGAGAPSLTDISFTAKRGQTIGVIGGTGSGKSSLINLIPRFYDATEGTVEILGRPAQEYPRAALRGSVAVVMQKAQLFGGTIRSNLLWGRKNASDEELWQALETAQAAEFVRAKPLGLDEPVEQGGRNLSGGQKQRLTIARALVGRPEILILDDSASALDYATDAALRKALAALPGNLTVFIVSQRAASLQHADQIIVLDDGRMVGLGRHTDLLKTCPVYEEIYASQFKKGDAQK